MHTEREPCSTKPRCCSENTSCSSPISSSRFSNSRRPPRSSTGMISICCDARPAPFLVPPVDEIGVERCRTAARVVGETVQRHRHAGDDSAHEILLGDANRSHCRCVHIQQGTRRQDQPAIVRLLRTRFVIVSGTLMIASSSDGTMLDDSCQCRRAVRACVGERQRGKGSKIMASRVGQPNRRS